ncbi:hypothetical protein [[Muricauda] lutisoli]|uniref:Uncharacterized protein n=1 Tax=[Muricauda] lutisoli TaxID=2816035 RepID=A0ABS3EW14_9FLAO|nr:hypothetical protein [[Muricauda] lutisoli]MBO0330435.1 hypothetical protein [[Muricauda] lutisoli]
MKKTALLLPLLLIGQFVLAQQDFTGTIPDWEVGSGDIITGLMQPKVIGSVDDQGNFKIPLNPNFLDYVKKELEEENKKDNDGWTASLMTVDKLFNCFGDSLMVENGNQPISRLSQMGAFMLVNMSEKKRLGYFFAVNSAEFAKSLMNIGTYAFTPGYYVDWYFVDRPGAVKGNCKQKAYALNQEEFYEKNTTYNLEFKEGWNIVKYEIKKVFKDKEGKTYPQEIEYITLPEIPKNITYSFIKDD